MEESIKALLRKLNKFTVNSAKAISYEKIALVPGTPMRLTPPSNANYAKVRIESAVSPSGYFMEFNGVPSLASKLGIPVLPFDIFDISDFQNLSNFQIDGDGILHVQYYNVQY